MFEATVVLLDLAAEERRRWREANVRPLARASLATGIGGDPLVALLVGGSPPLPLFVVVSTTTATCD